MRNAPKKRVCRFILDGGGCITTLDNGVDVVAWWIPTYKLRGEVIGGHYEMAFYAGAECAWPQVRTGERLAKSDYETLQDLANEMRRVQPLTHWRMLSNG